MATSAVALTSVGDGSHDAFYRGAYGAVHHRAFRDGTWSQASPFGGSIVGAPSAALSGSTEVVAVRGADNAMWLRVRESGSWSPWFSVGGVIADAPAVAVGYAGVAGRIDLYARGSDNALWTRSFVPTTGWSAWHTLGGILRSGPATAGGGEVYVTGVDHGIWSRSRNAGADTWSAWYPLGGQTFSAPAAARGPLPSGQDWVFVRGRENALWGRIDNQWRNLGGRLIDSPAATSRGTAVDVVVRGTDNALWSRSYRPGQEVVYRDTAWSNWFIPPPVYCLDSAPSNAAGYQAAFDGLRSSNTAGWIANDGGIPVPLTDGRVLWLFGDTLIGSPRPSATSSTTGSSCRRDAVSGR